MSDEQQKPARRRPGPRPKRDKFIATSIMMPPDLKAAVDAAAEAHDLSMAEVVRLALIEWLDRYGAGHG